VIGITELSHFGAASASVVGNKEAAHSTMTFTRFDTPRQFPKCRFDLCYGILHRLS
jgi:hypothetical protein